MSDATATLDLFDRARESLLEGYAASAASARHLAASLAALRAAAALLAARGGHRGLGARPVDGRSSGGSPMAAGGGPRDIWALTAAVAPELGEWAEVFVAATGQRVGVETGLVRVSVREADDLLRDAELFVQLVGTRLGLPVDRPRLRLAPIRSA